MKKKRLIKYLLLITFTSLMAWGAGFAYFIHEANSYKVDSTTATDAIVVISGARQRIETGIKLLQNEYAPILFITGIAPNNDMSRFLVEHKVHPEQVIYGGISKSTREDITEIYKFLNNHDLDSIRLVTSFYHMPRALAEAHKIFPQRIIVLPHPIHSNYNKNYALLFEEYNKYLLLLLFN